MQSSTSKVSLSSIKNLESVLQTDIDKANKIKNVRLLEERNML